MTPALVATIRSLVATAAPQELPQFEAELDAAAGTGAVTVLARWALRADPLMPEEQAAVERFKRTGEWQL